jgi:hypothetical protein
MKKRFIFIIIGLLSSSLISASDFTVNLNIHYNFGTSSFFDLEQKILSFGGNNYLQEDQNNMGLGCGASVNIPISKKLYISPAFTINVGHHTYDYQALNQTDGSESDTYFFIIYAGELNLGYDFFKLKNGIEFFAQIGLNYNKFDADAEMVEEDKTYMGMESALGAKFFGSKHFGFQVLGYYRMPLKKDSNSDPISFFGLKAGLMFKI